MEEKKSELIINPVYDDDISAEAHTTSNGANNNSKNSPASNGDVKVVVPDNVDNSTNAASTNSTNANVVAAETIWSSDKKKLLESSTLCMHGCNKKRCLIASVIIIATCLIIFLISYFLTTRTHSSQPAVHEASTGTKAAQYEVRLSSNAQGLVQFKTGNNWFTLCIDSWSNDSANVICRQLGYRNAVSWKLEKVLHKNTYMYNSRMPKCTGEERHLSSCPVRMNVRKVDQCPGSALFVDCDANMTTTDSNVSRITETIAAENTSSSHTAAPTTPLSTSTIPTTPSIPPFTPLEVMLNGSSRGLNNEGRLLVKHNNVWGTVCNELWSNEDALVICRQLGYSNYTESSIHHSISRFYEPNLLQVVWLTYVKCQGNETNLGQCEYTGWNITKLECTHTFDVKLSCLPDETTTLSSLAILSTTTTTVTTTRQPTTESTTFHAPVSTTPVTSTITPSSTTTALPIPTDALVTLQFGKQPNEGLLVITINGINYTVCDDFWDENAAAVVCRMNGYSEVINKQDIFLLDVGDHYMASEFDVFPSKMACRGNETNISDCIFSSMHSCMHADDVKLVCGPVPATLPPTTSTPLTTTRATTTTVSTTVTPFTSTLAEAHATSTPSISTTSALPDNRAIKARVPVRLAGGRDGSDGRLEVYINDTWGTVCSNRWSEENAEVVCRQQKYPGVEEYRILSQRPDEGIIRGADPQVIWLDKISCDGTEEYLTACEHELAGTHCAHVNDVLLSCEKNVTDVPDVTEMHVNGDIRLKGEPHRGVLEYYWDGAWGSVCDDGWDNNDAIVACRQLGYNNVSVHRIESAYDSDSSPYSLTDVDCLGTEERLSSCHYKNDSEEIRCYDSRVFFLSGSGSRIAIECDPSSKDPRNEIKLLHGLNASNVGMLQYNLDGMWGSLCRESWSYRSAEVACTQLGFPGVLVYDLPVTDVVGLRSSDFSAPFHGTSYQCTEQNKKISDCPHLLVTSSAHCMKRADEVAVICQPNEETTSFFTTQLPLNFTADDSVRLVGGTTEYEGRVEVLINGTWGRVCDKQESWSYTNMAFVCGALFRKGYSIEMPDYLQSLRGNGTFIAGGFDCSQYQPAFDDFFRLTDCSYDSREEYLRDCVTDAVVKCI
ncbi:deleted in malignant brain tumors 1 protein-like isoform X2 [Watersipora subatra]|uniref:deleted in malignant brain tumors 1 protein-like isoform X2 n=1 Tax=Watersipora subatra TaxID=2589382 RepID=UPI00355C3C17